MTLPRWGGVSPRSFQRLSRSISKVVWSVAFGPYGGGAWWTQCQEALRFHCSTRGEDPLAMDDYFIDLIAMFDLCRPDLSSDEGWRRRVREGLPECEAATKKFSKPKYCTWCMTLDLSERWDRIWHSAAWIFMIWALCTNHVTGDPKTQTMSLKALSAPPTTKHRITMKAAQAQGDRAMRGNGKAKLHMSAIILSEQGIQRRLRFFMRVAHGSRLWFGMKNTKEGIRSPESAQNFYARQAAGDCLDALALGFSVPALERKS